MPRHVRTGLRAASVSLTLLVRVVTGALRTSCGSSSTLPRDLPHRCDEFVQLLLALGLGWFDHERAAHDQREADRVRVESVVDEAFCDVSRLDACFACQASLKMHSCIEGAS